MKKSFMVDLYVTVVGGGGVVGFLNQKRAKLKGKKGHLGKSKKVASLSSSSRSWESERKGGKVRRRGGSLLK